MRPTILLIGTLDTKGEEVAYLREEIARRGCDCIVMDVGILGDPSIGATIGRDVVIERGGGRRAELTGAASKGAGRGTAVDIVIRGGTEIAKELMAKSAFDGAISLGGSTGTAIGTSIMRSLPFGIPKVQVSTLPGNSKDMTRFFDQKDIMMLNSVVDLVGLNSITRVVLEEAAGAITGMVKDKRTHRDRRRCVAITCLGVTTRMVMEVRRRLVEQGREVVVLHRRTQALEDLVAQGLVEAVLDLTPNELVDIVVYPGSPAEPDRFRSVREAGIPQIIAPGGLDMIILPLAAKDIPDQFKTRKLRIHTPWTTLVRTSEDELRALGKFIGQTTWQSRGPVGIIIPSGGFSAMDCEGSDFQDTKGNAAFVRALREAIAPAVDVREIPAHINSGEFVDAVIDMFGRMMGKCCGAGSPS